MVFLNTDIRPSTDEGAPPTGAAAAPSSSTSCRKCRGRNLALSSGDDAVDCSGMLSPGRTIFLLL